jgi:hypothetical protein
MTFRAPDCTTIVDFSIHRLLFEFNPLDGNPGREKLFDLGQLGATPFELTGRHSASASIDAAHWYGAGEATRDDSTVSRANFPTLAGYKGDATYLRYTIGCEAAQGCALWTNANNEAGSIRAQVFGASVTLNDPSEPAISDVKGTGLRSGVIAGDEPVAFDASDNSGIKRAWLVDASSGAIVGERAFACDYSYPVPCPQAQGALIAPSNALTAGRHQLLLRVQDAGDNVTDSGPFAVDVGGPANGSVVDPHAKLTATFARSKRVTLLIGIGKRATIKGKLTTAAGAPIANATLQVLDRELRTGTRYQPRLEITTGADGTFSVVAGKGAARAIRFEYRSRRLLTQPDVVRRVELRVQASSTLSISPRRVRAGGRIRISGRLRGLPTPRSGKIVELQAFEGGRWRDFRTTRASRTGRFATSYRFQRAGSGASFLIRARIRREDAYPYYLGYSPRVRVRVR